MSVINMLYKIANVKVSIKTSPIFLDNVFNIATLKNIYCKSYKNFIVIKNKYTYIIFKTNKSNENHINITKIPSIKEVLESIELLQSLFDFIITYKSIDNIIATTNLFRKLDLFSICKQNIFSSTKYNNEKFPGLFIKSKLGTSILFNSGKIVIVGAKTEKDIECLIQKICAHI
jgi:hypothetical protein